MTTEKFNKPKYQQQLEWKRSLDNPEAFWLEQAKLVSWFKQPQTAFSYKDPSKKHFVDWFPDGKLNLCYNALDRHVEAGYGDQVAVIYDSPVTATKKKFTFLEFLNQVKAFSKVLKAYNVNKGDTVVIYMPMVPETMIAMLSCARIGAVHSVVFGGFAPKELSKRIDDCTPKLILTATCGIESPTKIIEYLSLVNEALSLSKYPPKHKIILQREKFYTPIDTRSGDVDWETAISVQKENPDVEIAQLNSMDTMYTLYTSGTTGAPKGVSRPAGPHAVSLIYSMRHVFGLSPGEAFFASSDFGWAVGHSLTCYGALMNRNQTVVYEGKPVGTPDPGAFFRVLEEYGVKVMFTAPTALMILRREDPKGEYRKKYDISCVRGFFVSGEKCIPEIHRWWINHTTGNYPKDPELSIQSFPEIKNISTDHWWQTESGAPITALALGYAKSPSDLPPIRFGSVGFPIAGNNLKILRSTDTDDEDNEKFGPNGPVEAQPGEIGSVVLKLPLAPGTLDTLWRNDERFYNEYFRRFPGYYATGDTGMIDKDGYVYILSRDDDVINVSAHRLSTTAIEEVVAEHPLVAECCTVGRPHEIKGQVPMVFAVLEKTNTVANQSQIASDISNSIRNRVGAIASLTPNNVVFLEKMPKTRSGKLLRKMIRNMVQKVLESKQDPNIITIDLPATLEDPSTADDVWRKVILYTSKNKL
ncbi:hypothetical protein BB560_000448 [Smittium megazygosporum]|uniref:Propionate--CoA ligase n=1 Tax=Smittium megazygosporum TaxID=133381 RepID=A0A2T9ZKC5_9FUNG|nr:hypothetical protein BB560_000448 [Smittium megazygosporum]